MLWMPSRCFLTARTLLLQDKFTPRQVIHRCHSTKGPHSAPRFYAAEDTLQSADTGTLIQLPNDEARHATRILRLRDVWKTFTLYHTTQHAYTG